MAVLVLNTSMQPISVVSRKRLCVLLESQKVVHVNEQEELEAVEALLNRRMPKDAVLVRMVRTVHAHRRPLRPSRHNIFLRDGYSCQYCGLKANASELTIDHVLPLSKGGSSDSWENQVTACKKCNAKKSNKMLHDVGLKLEKPPVALSRDYAHVMLYRYPELYSLYQELLAA